MYCEESAESYNARVQEMIDRLDFDKDNFFIIETGRNKYEKSLILIKNGSYFGYGYIPINQMNSSLEHWENFIEHHKENKDTRVILQGYLRKYSKVNTRDYL